jgi:hypothetical protein
MPGRVLSAENARRMMEIRDAALRTLQDAGEAHGRQPFTDAEYEDVGKLADDEQKLGIATDDAPQETAKADTDTQAWDSDSPFAVIEKDDNDTDTQVFDVLNR